MDESRSKRQKKRNGWRIIEVRGSEKQNDRRCKKKLKLLRKKIKKPLSMVAVSVD
jgi:hypothetical protein